MPKALQTPTATQHTHTRGALLMLLKMTSPFFKQKEQNSSALSGSYGTSAKAFN